MQYCRGSITIIQSFGNSFLHKLFDRLYNLKEWMQFLINQKGLGGVKP